MGRVRRLKQLRTYEVALHKAGLGPVAGVDEAGRGACFGPITIAACVLPPEPLRALEGLTDSKRLTARRREALFAPIMELSLAHAIVHIPAGEIDHRGIQAANLDGARRAVAQLGVQPGYVLVDGFRIPGMPVAQLPVIGGDAAARCIAAASVLAKVSRDRLIAEMDEAYPGYGLAGHKGYGTKVHMDAVRRHGATPEHRYSYANVKEAHEVYTKGVL
ncbi:MULTISPECIES: ribonuclease HII [Corynebacterium]|uniref:Ribonuclease HII n=1 Tax=Corynebacterium imitans TaxID=156978 RepID=A0A076NQ11_9CORY|nr:MULTISPECIES: ribonuclease HII [Corynebacterium]AIJ33815.1 ribonuclease HII [Corynebacterium imitans]OFP36017.1 ribonuclease HII [Corynebacterium sp. HMSC071B10]SNV75994.1 Ribonuclease HII [Corynebacterium imitans]